MSNESWRDVMSLLGLVILADKRVYKEEVDTFVKAAVELNAKVNPGLFITDDMALGWFMDHRERLQNILKSSVSKPKIDKILNGLLRSQNQQAIVDKMEEIARADNDYHKDEHYIVNRAREVWRLPIK